MKRAAVPGVVREWHTGEGWGVIDSTETPGGCWAHFSDLDMTGYKELSAGEHVALRWEPADQDGFNYRAVYVVPSSQLAWHAYRPDGYEPEDEPWEPPPDGSVIRFMGDHCVGVPLWSDNDGLMFSDADEVVRDLGVSPDLAADLERWASGWEADSGKPHHRAEAEQLVERLNAELGHRYKFVLHDGHRAMWSSLEISFDKERRFRTVTVLMSLATLLGLGIALGWFLSVTPVTSYVGLDWIYRHRAGIGIVAILAATVGLLLDTSSKAARWTVSLGGVLAGLAWFWFASSASVMAEQDARWSGVSSQDGSLATNVVTRAGASPVWHVRVQPTDANPFSRQYSLGCVNGSFQKLRDVRWTAAGLAVESDFGVVVAVVDNDGRPVDAKGNPSVMSIKQC